MKTYKLLTPGPLTTTMTVKEQMLFDHCTWDDDYKQITQWIRAELARIANCSPETYTAVLMQGSGTFGDEAALTSVVGDDEKALICSNGAYGGRMVEVCRHARVPHAVCSEPYSDIPHVERIREMLDADQAITHVCMVHSETTTGLLNGIAPVGELCHERGLTFIVDAMSSFACVEMPVEDWHIDFLVSSANKGIQGRARILVHHLPPRQAGSQRGQSAQPVDGPLRPVGPHGARRQVALYLANPRGAGVCPGPVRTRGGGRHPRSRRALRRQPAPAGPAHGGHGLQSVPGPPPGTHHHHVLLSARRDV